MLFRVKPAMGAGESFEADCFREAGEKWAESYDTNVNADAIANGGTRQIRVTNVDMDQTVELIITGELRRVYTVRRVVPMEEKHDAVE